MADKKKKRKDKPIKKPKKSNEQVKTYKKFKTKVNQFEADKLTNENMENYSYREKIIHDPELNTLTFVFFDLVLKAGDYVLKGNGKRLPMLKDDFEKKYNVVNK